MIGEDAMKSLISSESEFADISKDGILKVVFDCGVPLEKLILKKNYLHKLIELFFHLIFK